MLDRVPSFTVETAEPPSVPLFGIAHDPLRVSYPLLSALCFHGLTNCFFRKPFPLINICVAPRVSPPHSSRRSEIHIQNESTPLSSYCYELFAIAKKITRIGISYFHTLSRKHPAWRLQRGNKSACSERNRQ